MGTDALMQFLANLVTVVGLPVALLTFVLEQRKARENEELELQERLASGYTEFLRLALDNADLCLLSHAATPALTLEQEERVIAIFGVLVALFERAFIHAYSAGLQGERLRRWRSWEDWMREWCAREDFRDRLDVLLDGEDPAFARHLRDLAAAATGRGPLG